MGKKFLYIIIYCLSFTFNTCNKTFKKKTIDMHYDADITLKFKV